MRSFFVHCLTYKTDVHRSAGTATVSPFVDLMRFKISFATQMQLTDETKNLLLTVMGNFSAVAVPRIVHMCLC